MGDLWPHKKSPQLHSELSVVQDRLIIYEKHSLVRGYSQILSRSRGEKSGELRRPGIIVHHGPEMWTRSVQRKSPTSPMLKYGSYRSRDLKLCRVTLTSECACVEWYGTCTTFVASFAGSPRARTKNRKERGEPGKIYRVRNVIGRENLITCGQMNEFAHTLLTAYTRSVAKALWLPERD